LVGVLAVVACGCRIAFDEVSVGATDAPSIDVLLGHDEDNDGISDVDDYCPHVPSATNVDTDGDRVGDVCDREPMLARQQWTLFSPMMGSVAIADGPAGAWTANADDWSYIDAPEQAQLLRAGMIADVDVWVGIDVEAIGTGGVQAAIIINGTTTPYWYGELFDGGTTARLSITEYDGSTYTAKASTPTGGLFPLGRIDLHLAARPGASFTLSDGTLTTTYATPGYAGDNLLIFAFGNHSGRVRYLAIVTSQ
jgi:hypothetical protein